MLKVLIAFLLLAAVVYLFGIRLGVNPHVSHPDPFPAGLHPCISCPYFQQAQSDPEHALTVCPECGLTLLPEEKTS